MGKSPDMTAILREMADETRRMTKAASLLAKIRDADVEIATAPKAEIWRDGKVSLHRYDTPEGVERRTGPVLLAYGLIGRYTMADLQPDRSLVRKLLLLGVDLYVVDWGHPRRADQHLRIDDYVTWFLDDCVEAIRTETEADKVSLLGICEGGTFCAIYAALFPEKIAKLITTITPIDFHADILDPNPGHGFINLWSRNLGTTEIDALLKIHGNLPGMFMGSVFQAITPVRTMTKYNRDLVDAAQDRDKLLNFLRMEKWIADRPDHPGAAARQWLVDLYRDNRLAKGTFEVNGQPVDLSCLKLPILNIFATQDHIIPPPCAQALGVLSGTDDYSEIAVEGGHVGLFVSRKSQGIVGQGIMDWLVARP